MQKVQSIKFIYNRFISKYWNKHINSFYYFLNNKSHSIDDTLQPKFGDKFEHRYKLFDHAKHSGTSYMNGHCVVSMTMSIPQIKNDEIRYITIPLGYKLYDKTCIKLELAKNLISIVMPELSDVQVIIL